MLVRLAGVQRSSSMTIRSAKEAPWFVEVAEGSLSELARGFSLGERQSAAVRIAGNVAYALMYTDGALTRKTGVGPAAACVADAIATATGEPAEDGLAQLVNAERAEIRVLLNHGRPPESPEWTNAAAPPRFDAALDPEVEATLIVDLLKPKADEIVALCEAFEKATGEIADLSHSRDPAAAAKIAKERNSAKLGRDAARAMLLSALHKASGLENEAVLLVALARLLEQRQLTPARRRGIIKAMGGSSIIIE